MTLEWNVGAAVLLAALLHASWNAMTKASRDPLLTLWLMTLTGSILGGISALFLDLPDPAAWPYLAASSGCHLGYMLFLLRAYRFGDLSRVYPIARGLAPVVVALLAAIFAGERLTATQVLGLAVSSAAIASLTFGDSGLTGISGRGVRAAVITGLLIGIYTVIDGSGARLAGAATRYAAWNLFLDGFTISIVVLFARRGKITAFLRDGVGSGVAGGVMASIAYAIVLWALTQGAMASVASLRETSVVFAALIGARLLAEPLGGRRLAAAIGVAAGLGILQASG